MRLVFFLRTESLSNDQKEMLIYNSLCLNHAATAIYNEEPYGFSIGKSKRDSLYPDEESIWCSGGPGGV
jgi:hypothetical protein